MIQSLEKPNDVEQIIKTTPNQGLGNEKKPDRVGM